MLSKILRKPLVEKLKCGKCGREILVIRFFIGTNHTISMQVFCSGCVNEEELEKACKLCISEEDSLDSLKHDPQEDDPIMGPIIKKAGEEAEKLVLKNRSRGLGDCHKIWEKQKKILKQRGIDWKSPSDMNPSVMFD